MISSEYLESLSMFPYVRTETVFEQQWMPISPSLRDLLVYTKQWLRTVGTLLQVEDTKQEPILVWKKNKSSLGNVINSMSFQRSPDCPYWKETDLPFDF